LGEDGSARVQLSEGHMALQKLLLKLKRSGILLTICSRNEEDDVRALFAERIDFPLRLSDFAAVRANWLPKSDNLLDLAKQLNIDPSAFLFVDDNPSELLQMAAAWPDIRLLRADKDGSETAAKLSHCPGLYQLHQDREAEVRTTD